MGKKLFLSGHDPSLVAYSIVRNTDGWPWNIASGSFISQSSGELPKYEYVLTQNGLTGYSDRDFPSGIAAGHYSAEYRLRASGVAAAWPNSPVSEKEYDYNGSDFVFPGDSVSGVLLLLSRLTSGRASGLDFLDVPVSSRSSGNPLTAAQVESAVHDAARSGHVGAGTYGELWLGYDGVARSGTVNSIQLASNAPVASISGQGVRIVGGYGAGQLRPATYYDSSTKWTSVSPNWDVVPDTTSLYTIVDVAPLGQMNVYDRGGFCLASGGLDQIRVESGVNARQALAANLAASAGTLSGAGTGAVTIKGGNVNTTRIAATTDVSGNRTSTTLTLPA